MSTVTLGTVGTTELTAKLWNAQINAADLATIQNSIKNDQNVAHPVYPGAFTRNGYLFVPNRGILRCLPGDYVAFDDTGWPILVSAAAIAGTSWSHS